MMNWKCFFIVIVLVSCGSKADHVVEEPHGYYFFPKPNIYYDTADKQFVYFDSSAKQWIQGNLPPAYVQADLGKSILIDSPPQPVWSANPQHQLVYAAKLYADSSDFKKKEPPVAKKTPRKKADTDPEDTEQKRKTKVGELLQKIFKKREQ